MRQDDDELAVDALAGARIGSGLLGVTVPIEMADTLPQARLVEIERRILAIEAALADTRLKEIG